MKKAPAASITCIEEAKVKSHALGVAALVLALGISSEQAKANAGECNGVLVELSACQFADQMVLEMLPQLPMRKTDGTEIVAVTKTGAIVEVTANFDMTVQELKESLVGSRMSIADLRFKAIDTTYDMTCEADVFRAFLDLGGEIRYIYYSSDGARVFEVLVVSCNNES
jgi:hypothetical protein